MADDQALDHIIDAYGGLALWRKLKCVILQLDSLGGPLLTVKGLRRTFAPPGIVTVDPVHRRAEFHDYPQPGVRAIFADSAVQLRDKTGLVIFEQSRHRERFRGRKKYRSWSHADAVYFFDYARTTYLSWPFILL